jgi:electron transport complex protein RnfB
MSNAGAALIRDIDVVLPQTQCTRCGYPSCRDYARALATGGADINRCPPGGAATIASLAAMLHRRPKPLDPVCGADHEWLVARIDEAACIGCTLCIQACPVDAIVGAGKRMHTVIASHCTGCELCIEPCPVDCIEMLPMGLARMAGEGAEAPAQGRTDAGGLLELWMRHGAPPARERFRRRHRRLARATAEVRRSVGPRGSGVDGRRAATLADRQSVIAAAVGRVRARRRGAGFSSG